MALGSANTSVWLKTKKTVIQNNVLTTGAAESPGHLLVNTECELQVSEINLVSSL